DLDLGAAEARLQAVAEAAARELLAPGARAADEERRFDREIVRELGRRGLLDERLSSLGMAVVAEELGREDSSVRGFVTVQSGLVARCLAEFGDAAARSWLPRLRSGEAVGCYALTEPEAGSDVRAMATVAEPSGAGYRLRGEKHWITNGGVADAALVFAQAPEGMTAFWVDTERAGFERSRMPDHELGHRASDHAAFALRGVEVPRSAVVGEVGGGHRIAMWALGHGRLGVAAGALGVLRASLDASVAFARDRRQFGRRIGDFEMVQSALADMAADRAAARLLVREAAWLRDQGRDDGQAVAIAKLFCTEAAVRAADQAILLHGARGYANGYPAERYWRDAKGMQIYEGTSHIQRIIIARRLLGRDEARG
ncbi:MAG: acyl-CoA dehydrogenase family protein, partial [Candidatus Dormiibacterota bacterium]